MIEDIGKPTTITIHNGYGIYSVSTNHSDVALSEMMELVERVLLAAGYDPQNIQDYFGEE